jgi:hypothetical protein
MKEQTITTFAILSLFTMAVPSANADTYSSTTTTEERAPTRRVYTSMKVEGGVTTEVSDTPIYAESLKTNDIIEKHKHHHLVSGVKHRAWL